MKLEKHPFFRKVITPWYDSDTLCWTVAVLSFVVFAFSVVGVKVSIQTQGYVGYIWFPLLLGALSFFLFLKIVIRVTKRRKAH
ncbi:MAG: hypothetical protein K9J83_06320 [Desulfarculaceae bacterium]|nr:hypothetical protein [Desulfarculaceae bacterium]